MQRIPSNERKEKKDLTNQSQKKKKKNQQYKGTEPPSGPFINSRFLLKPGHIISASAAAVLPPPLSNYTPPLTEADTVAPNLL